MMYSEKTLRRKANKVGLTLEKGYQKYLCDKWGFVLDADGQKVTGYSLFNSDTGCYTSAPYLSSACHTHEMNAEEVESYLRNEYQKNGLTW